MPQIRQLAAIIPPEGGTEIVGYIALMCDNEQKAFKLLNKKWQIQNFQSKV